MEDAKSRGPPEIHPCLSCSGLGLGTSRGKERRRTSRPTNLHIWLRVATAPIGIAKSQIGLVRGPDPLRRPSPLIRRRRFSWKSISRQAFRYVTFPSTRSRCLVILIHGIMRPEGCLTGCNNNLGIQQMLRLLFEYVFAFCQKKKKKKGKSFSYFSFRPLLANREIRWISGVNQKRESVAKEKWERSFTKEEKWMGYGEWENEKIGREICQADECAQVIPLMRVRKTASLSNIPRLRFPRVGRQRNWRRFIENFSLVFKKPR